MVSLEIRNLSISQNKKILINHINASFEGGDIIALVGDNGSGKTTFLKTLAGLIKTTNQIFIKEHAIEEMSFLTRSQLISLLLQDCYNQTYCSAESRISHGLMPTLGFNFLVDNQIQETIRSLATSLNISHLLHRRLAELSGGEQRLVHIAKCLIGTMTRLLLLDEPSVFLDFKQSANLSHTLKKHAEQGKIIIFSSHDSAFIRRTAHRVIALENGLASIVSTTVFGEH